MELLFVNACPRGEASRTLALAESFLSEVRRLCPGLRLCRQDLPEMGLEPMDARRLARREALCDAQDWSDPLIAPALALQRAEAVVLAAPYWDLSFPAILKVWAENVWVRNLTFRYENDRPLGLCRGRAAVWLTTAGSVLAGHDWGTLYVQDMLRTLGIPAFRAVKAERMDLWESDPEALLARARGEAAEAAAWLCSVAGAPPAP